MNKITEISKFCGVCKINDENTNYQDEYIIYAQSYFIDDGDLGNVVGRGKTKEKALIQALDTLVKCLVKAHDKHDKLMHFLEEFRMMNFIEIKPPIFPLENYDGDIENAVIKLLEGKPNLCIG